MPPAAIGTRIFVEEDAHLYIAVGSTTAEIEGRLGWVQQNVWLPLLAGRYIEKNHPEFPDPLHTIQCVLSQPRAVFDVPEQPTQIQFFATADSLRAFGLITSRSARFVDVLVEYR
ncbi:hypothetical protein [Nitrolancea hollandica]|uniref:Uncharacterized protein n=1 Tax=Nitrolancea hollandica Lb TaxID=1129897 RepID=I4EE42_9BACT|nr:hypothetical protein [Nitrolancea hollandica]CCF82954.1 hypothetical protein NITHO_1700012 [Nitrolancea hollandica Lb]